VAIIPTPAAAPAPPAEPEPRAEAVAETEPVMKITLEPSVATTAPAAPPPAAQAPTTSAGVFVRLTSGERISAGRYETLEAAERRARELMVAVDAHGDWPCVDGRFIKPDAVVSIDVES
jgi:hypothetical protein